MSDRFPRQKLAFSVSRRQFLPALVREFFSLATAASGRVSYQLADLGDMPDDQLSRIVPMINPAFEITVADNHLCSLDKRSGNSRKHFPLSRENTAVFNLFNGNHTIGQITLKLAAEMEWDENKSFAHVRDLFLSLVSYVVCIPKNQPM